MKTTKGGKVMNPTDAYRKELRKKELKRNKKERKKVREVGILKKDPETIKDQIDKLEMMKADGALDKARKHKKRQLEDTLNLVLKKRKEYEEKMREKGETPVMFSHLGPLKRRTTAEEEERVMHPKPEDSVYYHPTLNPTGAPPPGKPPMYKSSIGPRIPLGASTSTASSSSNPEHEEEEEEGLGVPPLPPPPPLPSNEVDPADDSDVPVSLPLPPPPPAPPMPAKELTSSLPRPPLPPPPPPGLPPKGSAGIQPSLSPPPPPGTTQASYLNNKSVSSEGQNPMEFDQATAILRPAPPPPPGLPPKQADQSEASASESSTVNTSTTNEVPRMVHLPPPPPRQLPPPPPRFPLVQTQPSDMLPPGVSRLAPPPSDMMPPPVPGLPSRPPPPPPPGMHVLPSSMPAYGVPQMPHGILRPPLPPGPPPFQEDAGGHRFYAPQKPSYVKSAAPTVVKRPLAQHTPELTAMIPASVRVRRETTAPKAKLKAQLPMVTTISKPSIPAAPVKSLGHPASISAPKTKSIDDSYMAFLEDMKELGALDG